MAASIELCLKQINIARNELKNIRQQIETLKRLYKKDVEAINKEVKYFNKETKKEKEDQSQKCTTSDLPSWQPIGYLRSCFKNKNGTPRQPSVCSFARGRLQISKSIFVHPEHSLEGLENFSHVWILFVFHDNGPLTNFTKAKVKPPRLDGNKTGLFSTRSPHRPNPIGLSLAKLDKVQGDTIYLSGIDIIDNTPILDIKPYVPMYDNPEVAFIADSNLWLEKQGGGYEATDKDSVASMNYDVPTPPCSPDKIGCDENLTNSVVMEDVELLCFERTKPVGCLQEKTILERCTEETTSTAKETKSVECVAKGSTGDVTVPDWITSPPVKELNVRFTPNAVMELESLVNNLQPKGIEEGLDYFTNAVEVKQAITAILAADPRSSYRRNSCLDKLYYFTVDKIHVTVWFGENFAEVLQVKMNPVN